MPVFRPTGKAISYWCSQVSLLNARTVLFRLLVAWSAAIVLALLSLGAEAELARAKTFDLAAIQIDDQDVPSGYIPLDNEQLAEFCLPLEFLDQQIKARSHVRAWVQPDSGRCIASLIVEARSEMQAGKLGEEVVSELEKSALRHFTVPKEVVDARGFVTEKIVDGFPTRASIIIFRRDRLVFSLSLRGDGSTEEESIIQGLAVRQEAKAPSRSGESSLHGDTTRWFVGTIAGLVGVIAFYTFVVNDAARRRDPLRPPKVTLETGIKLLQTQIAEGQKLLSCRPISTNTYKAWKLKTRHYLENVFAGDFEQYDIGKSRSDPGDPAFPRNKVLEWWKTKRTENLQTNLNQLEDLVEELITEAQRRDQRRQSMSTGDRAGVVDVTSVAQSRQSEALRRHILRLVGVLIALSGLLLFLWSQWGLIPSLRPQSLFLILLGWMVGYGPAVWQRLRRRQDRRTGGRRLFTGSRPIPVTLLVTVAMVLLMAGLLFILTFGAASEWAVGEDEAGLRNLWFPGLVLIVIGTGLYNLAHRLAALRARELLQRDTRPKVLYLRAFRDDVLKLRTATYSRPSLIERLSPRRFDRFEEVIARHLGDLGPVIALNPPGTLLPPLGAARETYSHEEWKGAVKGWMTEAQLIVVQVPGVESKGVAQVLGLKVKEVVQVLGLKVKEVAQVFGLKAKEVVQVPHEEGKEVVQESREEGKGLAWELQKISDQGLWSNTLLVLPPVPAFSLRKQWQYFAELLQKIGVSKSALPTDPAETLAVAWPEKNEWLVFVADARNEWTYAVSLMKAATQLSGSHPPGERRRQHSVVG
jgi:hypothetical protein